MPSVHLRSRYWSHTRRRCPARSEMKIGRHANQRCHCAASVGRLNSISDNNALRLLSKAASPCSKPAALPHSHTVHRGSWGTVGPVGPIMPERCSLGPTGRKHTPASSMPSPNRQFTETAIRKISDMTPDFTIAIPRTATDS